jgi:hypothetical protein
LDDNILYNNEALARFDYPSANQMHCGGLGYKKVGGWTIRYVFFDSLAGWKFDRPKMTWTVDGAPLGNLEQDYMKRLCTIGCMSGATEKDVSLCKIRYQEHVIFLGRVSTDDTVQCGYTTDAEDMGTPQMQGPGRQHPSRIANRARALSLKKREAFEAVRFRQIQLMRKQRQKARKKRAAAAPQNK